MNARPNWAQEVWRIAVLIALAWFVGSVFDQITLFLLLALLAYTFRNLFNLWRLANWLGDSQPSQIPIRFGLWGDVYSRISRIARRQAQREKRLAGLLNEYASSTSALPDAAVALDPDGRIRWFNDAASLLLGLKAAKDVGQPLLNLFRAPDMVAFLTRRDYSSILQTTAPGNVERQLEVRLTPYGDGQTLLLAQDITERLQHERMRKDFVANVSHELRTPLTVISGFIENLQDSDGGKSPALARPLELMGQQAARMSQIVEDLLLLARLESGARPNRQDEVNMGELCQAIAGECRALRDDVPTIECDISSSRRVLGDEKQLRSALTNLVVNAVNHTPAAGRVVISWQDRDDGAAFSVADDGAGIAAEHLPRLTERFYRVDAGRSRERGGTGLGLAIVKHIMSRHAARLEISSNLGQGSRFTGIFPALRVRR